MGSYRCNQCRGELQFEEANYDVGKATLTCSQCNVEYTYERTHKFPIERWKLIKAKRIKQETKKE